MRELLSLPEIIYKLYELHFYRYNHVYNYVKGVPMSKQKIDKNYLDFIPVKNPEIKYETNDKGNITVFIRWEGFFNKIAQKFFHRPKVSSIDLDDYLMPIFLKWKNHSLALLNFLKF